MTRLAAVDCGTNSIRLLVSDYDPASDTFTELVRDMRIIRLGEGVDATGRISEGAIERARAALTEFVEIMKHHDVTAVRMVATSATRDAENRADFLNMTAELLGQIQPGAMASEISGEDEARLSFLGAIMELPADLERVCVMDLGGGSTEFIVGTRDGSVTGAKSVQVGCVRLTERFLHTTPPTQQEIHAAHGYVREKLAEVRATVPLHDVQAFVGVAGTFTTLSALAMDLPEYDSVRIHNSVLNFERAGEVTQELLHQTPEQRCTNPVIHPGRADVIGGGSIAVEEIMALIEEETGLDSLLVSEKDILDGILIDLAER